MATASPCSRRAWLALALALPLVACSGTPLGEQLSDSFSEPSAGEVAPADGASPAEPPPTAAAPDNAPARSPAQPADAPTAGSAAPRPAALAPAPYRLVLRLPAADPAAPAEAVTEALRAAGVSFEVETIERVPAANSPGELAPSPVTPAPAPSAQPAPAPR
jgi:hypothetical protein